jgi:hypothetical protein
MPSLNRGIKFFIRVYLCSSVATPSAAKSYNSQADEPYSHSMVAGGFELMS